MGVLSRKIIEYSKTSLTHIKKDAHKKIATMGAGISFYLELFSL